MLWPDVVFSLEAKQARQRLLTVSHAGVGPVLEKRVYRLEYKVVSGIRVWKLVDAPF